MAKHIETSIEINVGKKRVWDILTDFDAYPEWNPFIKSIKGTPKVGGKIKIKLPDMAFTPTIKMFEKEAELKWLGHLWFKGLFDGEHHFQLVENNDGTTTFHHSETFTGILVGLFAKSLDTKTKDGFERMNQKLKQRAESMDYIAFES